MLSRLQAVAVDSGNPVQIASASREMNAELLFLLGSVAVGENQGLEAAGLFRESLALHPNTDVQLRLATLLARDGHSSEATQLAQDVIAKEPGNARAFSTLASVLRTTGKNREAIDALNHALQLDPSPSLAFALGSALLAVHDQVRASEVFTRLLTASDGAAIWHVAIGDAYREAGYLNEAADEFRKALAIDPHATHAEFFLGLVSLQMNEWGPNSESFTHLRKSVEQNPHEYLSNFYLGALESTDGSDLAASDRHLRAAADADSTQPEVWIYLGQNANREHRTEEAVVDLRKAVQLSGTDEGRNHYQIRRAYFTLGRLLIAGGNREEGERFLADYKRTSALDAGAATASIASKESSSAVSGDTSTSSDKTLLGLAHDPATQAAMPPAVDIQPPAKAPPELQSMSEKLRALLAGGYNDLGTAEARQQQYAVAQHDFEQAERFGLDSPTLLRNLALVASRLNDTSGVKRSLTAYFDAVPTPTDPHARLMLAMALFDSGQFNEAVQNFADAGSLTMADARSAYSNAYALARIGQAKEASAMADELVASNLPTSRLALVCNVYFTAENYASSASCYTKVAQQDPTFQTAHYFVAESLLHQDHPAEAIPQLKQELLLTPGEPNVASALAFALLQTGSKEEAQKLLTSTVTAHPEHAEGQYQLGKLLAEEGKSEEAISHLEASVRENPSKDYAHYQLATCYRKAGRAADANREFAAYRQIKEEHRTDRAIPSPSAAQGPPATSGTGLSK